MDKRESLLKQRDEAKKEAQQLNCVLPIPESPHNMMDSIFLSPIPLKKENFNKLC